MALQQYSCVAQQYNTMALQH